MKHDYLSVFNDNTGKDLEIIISANREILTELSAAIEKALKEGKADFFYKESTFHTIERITVQVKEEQMITKEPLQVWIVKTENGKDAFFNPEDAENRYYELIEEILEDENMFSWYENDLQEPGSKSIELNTGFTLEEIKAYTREVMDTAYDWFMQSEEDSENEVSYYPVEVK